MDPGSLPVLARNNPACRFIVPRAETGAAAKSGIPPERTVAVNSGESVSLSEDLTVEAMPAAHESLKLNERGEHHFLGYIFRTPRLAIYHSGDCVPYDGLTGELLRRKIDLALLPVNGRDAYRTSRGIAGNFTFAEARRLCADARIPCLIPHHFGMFAFNTPSPAELQQAAARADYTGCCRLPSAEFYYLLKKDDSGTPLLMEV
jgi:L-ascorbate metabolism protein UlaG (beta-lactamase superfamily)